MSSSSEIDKLLNANNLYRKEISRGPNSLMRAISDSLYFSPHYHADITQMVVQYLKKLLVQDQVPKNLAILQTNLALQQDYTNQPTFMGFDRINLELVSLLFRVKINMYFISSDMRLSARIINQNYTRMIEIFQQENHYDSIYSQQFIKNTADVQQIVYETLNQAIGHNGQIPKCFKNVWMDVWLEEKMTQQLKQQKSNNRVRSFSDNFNNDEQKVDQLYTKLEQQFGQMFEQESLDVQKTQVQKLSQELNVISKKQHRTGSGTNLDDPSEEEQLQLQLEQLLNIRGAPPGISSPKNQQQTSQQNDTPSRKPIIIDESSQRYTGKLKFFDEGKSYGFLVLDNDQSDIFVHYDDLMKAGITKDFMRTLGTQYKPASGVNHFGKGNVKAPRFSFVMMVYVGKYNKSRKAIDLKLLVEQ